MISRSFCAALLLLCACQSQDQEASTDSTRTQVEITGSRSVEPSDLSADGGSFRDPSNPFWQVEVYRGGIDLNGAASPAPRSMVTLPAARSTVHGATETWLTESNGQKIQIEAVRERCVRDDGFVFREKVTVEIGTRRFVSCGERGSDPPATR